MEEKLSRAGAPEGGARPHVVIVGAGFGGIYAARSLRRAPVRVTVIDRRNHHLFQPLLYQVATAGLNAADIAYPIRSVVRRQDNARVLLGEVSRIDTAARRVVLDGESIDYDYLVVATGATHSYFQHPEWEAVAPGLKTIEDALLIRRRVFLAYEAAEREPDPARRAEWLTFVVVGGGPTGVELAGALSEIARHTLKRDFRSIDPTMTRVLLLEGVDRVLPPYVPELSHKARRQLERLGVEVRTGALVSAVDGRGVEVSGGERIQARTVLWAAGVAASPLARTLGVPLDHAGRVEVKEDLGLPGHPEVFVVGDLAAVTQADGSPVPGVAPAAIQEGRFAARQIRRELDGAARERFRYRDKGSVATIGRAAAVADLGWIKLSGFLAWLAWWAIHIFFLIGFRSRLLVMFGWAWSYFTFQRGARLITGEVPPLVGGEAGAAQSAAPTPAPGAGAPAPDAPADPARSAARPQRAPLPRPLR
ncbi:MAG TPA: NAD(P)/FAD-dependent oxidoreductase [Kofleriaceae bacterium]|nr:NAD(P)/FAD-dependent oxidoreductase [Kofleriaceae bacterium]